MGGTTRTLSYAYNARGARTQINHPDGIFFATLLDGFDRPYYAYDSAYAAIALYTYTPTGTLDHSAHGAYSFYGYDGLQRPNVRLHAFNGGVGSVLWTYAFNPAGGLSSVSRDNDAFAWTRHYAVTRAYATNGLNQYTGTGGPTFTYDDNGNLTSDGARAYLYDIENRLVLTSTGASLVYDPLGRLYQVAGDGNITRFLYDGDALVVEYDTNGVVQRRHVHGAGADTAMITYEGAGLSNPRNLFADHQGSIVAHANASGATLSVNTYDEYGIPGLGNTGRFQYTGQVWLAELAMYYYKARIYSPTLGRFLQTDPIGYDDQFNLYAYVGNDPINSTDPSGMAGECSTGSKTGGNNGGCRVAEGYEIKRTGRPAGRAGRSRNPQTPAGNHQENINQRLSVLHRDLQILDPGAQSIGMPSGQGTMVAVRSMEARVEALRSTPFRTNAEAGRTAGAMGYRQVGERSHRQAVFTNGRQYISRDIDSHNGGVWKVGPSIRSLSNPNLREGTYNRDLTERIGD